MTLCKRCGFTIDGPLHAEANACRPFRVRFPGTADKAVTYGPYTTRGEAEAAALSLRLAGWEASVARQ
jgi:hypothetical protein